MNLFNLLKIDDTGKTDFIEIITLIFAVVSATLLIYGIINIFENVLVKEKNSNEKKYLKRGIYSTIISIIMIIILLIIFHYN